MYNKYIFSTFLITEVRIKQLLYLAYPSFLLRIKKAFTLLFFKSFFLWLTSGGKHLQSTFVSECVNFKKHITEQTKLAFFDTFLDLWPL